MMQQKHENYDLPPMANAIIDKAVDNVTRKLVAGYRNKKNSRPNAKNQDVRTVVKDTMAAVSADSVMDVANRGADWKELLQKTLSHGISSIGTMQFDGSFTVKNGQAQGLDGVPNSPGVYVVFNKEQEAVYVGDSAKLKQRWHAGHLNEHAQAKKSESSYKLSKEFDEGCVVRFVKLDSSVTAAAVEAHLIATEDLKNNSKEELKYEQGARDNIEAKKMKDASGSFKTLAVGAAKDAVANVGWGVFEQLSTELIKALKDELIDIAKGGKHSIGHRLKRLFDRVWAVIQKIIDAPLSIISGIFEFIVNAISKTIQQFYHLAKNICELGLTGWSIYKGSASMSNEDLTLKITETVVLSGTLILWDALDPVLEASLASIVGPVAPYLSATICALGYGLSSFYLQKIVPSLIKLLLLMRTSAQEAVYEMRRACEQLIAIQERELELLSALKTYAKDSFEFIKETQENTQAMIGHKPISHFDVNMLLSNLKK